MEPIEVIPGKWSLRCWWYDHDWLTASRPYREDASGRICRHCGRQEWPTRKRGLTNV